MANFSLAAYTLRAKHGKDRVRELGNFCQGTDLIAVVHEFMQGLERELSHDQARQKLMRVSTVKRNDRTITGIIETGEYGFESDLFDAGSRRRSYRRRTTDAEMLPFYFLVDIPETADEGIMILQRFKQFGIRATLSTKLKEHLPSACPDAKLSVHPLVPEQLVKEYLQDGRITKVTFVSFRIPTDVTDAYDKRGHIEEGGRMELSVHAKRNGELPLKGRIRQVLTKKRPVAGVIEFQNFEYENVKLAVRVGKGTHTIDLSNFHKLRAHYDVTDRVTLSNSGHPSFDSIDSVAHELLRDLREALGGGHTHA